MHIYPIIFFNITMIRRAEGSHGVSNHSILRLCLIYQ